jgi:regulator of sigma E protease
MTTVVSFIIVLGILVTVHELGHFLVAKAIGLGVERFSIGFPPKMFGFMIGETEYCVSWIPLGGYVKLKGEDPDEEAQKDVDNPKHFMSRPPHQRAAVTIAGPLMNLALAFLLMPMVFVMGTTIPTILDKPPVVGWIQPDSPADRAYINKGDRILNFDGEPVPTWGKLDRKIASAAGKVDIVLDGPGGIRTVSLDIGVKDEMDLGIYPQMDPVIGTLVPGFPAQKAGIHEGDRILALGGVPVSHFKEVARIIRASAGKSITFSIERDGGQRNIPVIPELDENTGYGRVGITSRMETTVQRFGIIEALKMGTAKNLELLGLTFSFIWDLVTLNSSIKNLGGPIMIFQVTGQAAKAGFAIFIEFMAFLSLQLGVLNLLPIPVLDGGQLVFLTIEGVKRKPLDLRTREMAQRVGLFLLLFLILVISYNDIVRILTAR